MSVDEGRRIALHEAAAHNRWTAEAALTLMELLPPSGWGDVVRRSDLDALEQRMDLRFRLVDQRFESLEERIDQRFDAFGERIDSLEERIDLRIGSFEERIDLRIERALNRSLRWTVGTIIALTGVVAAVTAAVTAIS